MSIEHFATDLILGHQFAQNISQPQHRSQDVSLTTCILFAL